MTSLKYCNPRLICLVGLIETDGPDVRSGKHLVASHKQAFRVCCCLCVTSACYNNMIFWLATVIDSDGPNICQATKDTCRS